MTSKLRRSRTRLMMALAAMAAMMFALMPAAPAAADPGAVAVVGTAVLNAGISAPCSSNVYDGSFSGWAVGVHASTPPGLVAAAPVAQPKNASASYKYCNSTTALGTAVGTLTVNTGALGTAPSHTCGFSWQRIGAIAVVSFTTCGGAAVAAFAPSSLPGAVPGTAEVVGAGVITH